MFRVTADDSSSQGWDAMLIKEGIMQRKVPDVFAFLIYYKRI